MGIKVLKAECGVSAFDAFAVKLFSPNVAPPYYVQFDVMVPAATFAAIAAKVYSADFLEIDGASNSDGIFLTGEDPGGTTHPFSSGNRNLWTDFDPGNPVTAGWVDEAWLTIKAAYDGATITWTLPDGSTTISYARTLGSLADIQVGGIFSNAVVGEIYYIDNVCVGTTPGAGDIFTDDFETGDLSNWDSTTGTVSVVDDPLGTGGPSTCGAPAEGCSLALDSPSVSVVQGGTGADGVTSTLVGGPDSNVTLSSTGEPAGVTVTFGTNPIDENGGTSTISVAVGGGVAPGSYAITIHGADENGNTCSAPLTLIVTEFVAIDGLHIRGEFGHVNG